MCLQAIALWHKSAFSRSQSILGARGNVHPAAVHLAGAQQRVATGHVLALQRLVDKRAVRRRELEECGTPLLVGERLLALAAVHHLAYAAGGRGVCAGERLTCRLAVGRVQLDTGLVGAKHKR